MFSWGGSLLPFSYADARCIDAVIVSSKASDAKVSGVVIRGNWNNAVRVFNGEGATSPPFDGCPAYFNTGCQAGRKPPLATKNLLEVTDGLRRPPFYNPPATSRCCSPLLLLMCALLMPSLFQRLPAFRLRKGWRGQTSWREGN